MAVSNTPKLLIRWAINFKKPKKNYGLWWKPTQIWNCITVKHAGNPKKRERISCYSQKQYKQNEAIYHYNTDGTINKIEDNFTTFYTQYFYYTNKELSKIVTKDRNDKLVDEVLVHCETKDEKGTCLKETRISTKTNYNEELVFSPIYD